MKSVVCLYAAAAVIALGSIVVTGQDLGTGNGLFGTHKPSPAKKTAKKATPKSASGKATAKRSSTTAKGKPKPAPQTERDVPVSPAAAQLYEKLIEDGNAARDQRNYAAAETAYTRAKSIKPKDARALQGLGNLYSDQQRWDDAEKAYRAALQMDDRNASIYIALSYVLSQPLFVNNLSDRYEESEKLSRRAIELAPSSALAFDQLGVSMELRGLIGAETENAYRNAIRLDPAFAPPYAHLGRLLRRRGLSKESVDAYANATRNATSVPTMIIVADVLQSEQRFADSEPLLRRAVERDPRNPTALLLLGRALTTMGKFDDAERVLRRGLDVSPASFTPNLLLGSLYARQGKYDQAENALLQALRFVSQTEKRNLSQQFEAVGDGYMTRGNSRGAERAYRQALALDGEKDILAGKLARATEHS